MPAALAKFNLVGIALLCLSGAEPARECPAPPVWLAPERTPLALAVAIRPSADTEGSLSGGSDNGRPRKDLLL